MRSWSGYANPFHHAVVLLLAAACLFGTAVPAFASESDLSVRPDPFRLDLKTEITLGASTFFLSGGSKLVGMFRDEAELPDTFDNASVNWLDRRFMGPYDKGLDLVSDVTSALSLVSPALLLLMPQSRWVTIGVMYAESIALSYGLKQLGKTFLPRTRPYMYYDGEPADAVSKGDWNQSFPSGHTTLSFTSASFVSYVFGRYYPDSRWRIPVTVASFAMAGTTAILRVASGSHFVTDITVGAVLGTLSGLAIPYLHTHPWKPNGKGDMTAQLTVIPNGVLVTLSV